MQAAEIRSAALAAKTLNRIPVKTPEWGVPAVYVRSLRGDELSKYRNLFRDERGERRDDITDEQFIAHLVVLCACDESGEPVFSNGDAAELLSGPLAPLQRCYRVAWKLNGLSEYDERAIEGNSEPTPTK